MYCVCVYYRVNSHISCICCVKVHTIDRPMAGWFSQNHQIWWFSSEYFDLCIVSLRILWFTRLHLAFGTASVGICLLPSSSSLSSVCCCFYYYYVYYYYYHLCNCLVFAIVCRTALEYKPGSPFAFHVWKLSAIFMNVLCFVILLTIRCNKMNVIWMLQPKFHNEYNKSINKSHQINTSNLRYCWEGFFCRLFCWLPPAESLDRNRAIPEIRKK